MTFTERPILFSGAMVRAILAGTKTMTRRVVKLPHENPLGKWEPTTIGGKGTYLDKAMTKPAPELLAIWHTRTGDSVTAPYSTGDRLWVRETHYRCNGDGTVLYRATDGDDLTQIVGTSVPQRLRWTPAIHMPRRFSRLTLEVVNVRVERLQEISERDCMAEGISRVKHVRGMLRDDWKHTTAFMELWDGINAKRGYGWDANPWVWCVTFRPISPTAGAGG